MSRLSPRTVLGRPTVPPDQGTDEAAKPPRLRARERGRARRRLRYLRQVRELQLRDAGGFVFDLYRFGERRDELVRAKLDALITADREIRELEALLGKGGQVRDVRQPGVGGTCPNCGAFHASDASFCAQCGAGLAVATPAAVEDDTAPQPAAEEPVAEPTAVEEPVAEPTAVEEPAAGEAPVAVEEPAAAEEPDAAEEPAAEEPVAAEEPAAEEPAPPEPVSDVTIVRQAAEETGDEPSPAEATPVPNGAAPTADVEPPSADGEEPPTVKWPEPKLDASSNGDQPTADAGEVDPDTGEVAAVGRRDHPRTRRGRARRRRGRDQ